MRSNFCAIVAVLLSTSAASPAFAASLTPLGDLPGGDFISQATGVSGDGSVVVGLSCFSGSGYQNQDFQAFRWTSGGGIVALGSSGESAATGISADGSVIVGALGSLGDQAVRWTSGGMVPLGDLPGGADYSTAAGVSGDGSVIVGTSSSENSPFVYEAFRWTAGSGMVGLGDLPGGDFDSDARGVSGDGSVVVGFSGNQAFRWTSADGMVGLGVGTYAYGVSSDGSVIVGQMFSASGVGDAFRWTSDGGMVGLGGSGSVAYGVNSDGSVIVGQSSPFPGAFRWTSSGGMERLWDVLVANGVDPAADGWSDLLYASGTSLDGKTIVGAGSRNNTIEAFIAFIPIVPEPAAGALALLGVSSILLLRRRSLWRPNKVSLSKDEPCD